jgi:hypothetical protein
MKKSSIAVIAVYSFLATAASAAAQTVSPTPLVTPSGTDIAGSAVAAVVVVIVFAFIIYAGYRIIRKWSGSSKGESD